MIIALAGNQNSGKTTLFNALTGSNQHVGNWPGVTVEKKEGKVRSSRDITLVDLPGVYSLSPYSLEEVITRDYLTSREADGIINIVDATNLVRNLYLSLQLAELGKPMVIALNMMDEARARGDIIHAEAIAREIGIPVIPIVARSGEGLNALIHELGHAMREERKYPDVCRGALHEARNAIEHLIEGKAEKAGLPYRYASAKLVEGDELIQKQLELDSHEIHIIGEICELMEHKLGQERDAALADARYQFIEGLCARNVKKRFEGGSMSLSNKIDSVLTHKYLAIPSFLGILSLIFWFVFGPVGTFLSDGFASFLSLLSDQAAWFLEKIQTAAWLQSLVIDGVLAGIFGMLGFLPVILMLFVSLSILEDSGYMARAAFVMDKLLRRFGLSGRAFFPMIMGFGCSVPAIMSARGMTNVKERRLAVLVTPFMSCAARIPIYGLFIAAFFPKYGALAMMGIYVFGVVTALLCAYLLKDTKMFKAGDVPFVMELPPYRLPTGRTVLRLVWDKGADFVKRAFTIIFCATIVIWFLQNFSPALQMVSDDDQSLLAMIGSILAPIFKPLGFGTWQASTSLLTGFAAKEAVVSTMAVLYSTTADMLPSVIASQAGFTAASALSFMVFTLLYMPCVAAFAAMKREMGGLSRAIGAAAFQTGVAWVMGFVVFQFARLLF